MKRRTLFFRRLRDRAVTLFSYGALAVSLLAMGLILYAIIVRGSGAISWDFLTNAAQPYGSVGGGIANALIGSIELTFCAALCSVIPGIASGIYLSEFGKGTRLGSVLNFIANTLMGVPSILIGLFVYTLLVVPTGHFSGFAGAVALAIMMYPVVMRTSADMLSAVPDALREAALALGMSRTRATLCIVCRAAKNGMLSGILLSLARVSGETAPLLFTALYTDAMPRHFFTQPTASVPVLINEYAGNSPFAQMHEAAWCAALVMTLLILGITIATRALFREENHG